MSAQGAAIGALANGSGARARLIDRWPWLRAGFVVGVLILAFVVSQSCQKSQIRLTKDQALARAEQQVDFKPTREQIRLLRQGVGSKPFWIVSLSIPRKDRTTFSELAVIRINANTGKVTDVKVQR